MRSLQGPRAPALAIGPLMLPMKGLESIVVAAKTRIVARDAADAAADADANAPWALDAYARRKRFSQRALLYSQSRHSEWRVGGAPRSRE